MEFEGVDFLNLDNVLTDEERMIRGEVRRWIQKEVIPVIAEYFEAGAFPMQLLPKMLELNLLGANIEPCYGGVGLNSVAYGIRAGRQRIEKFCLPSISFSHVSDC